MKEPMSLSKPRLDSYYEKDNLYKSNIGILEEEGKKFSKVNTRT